MAARSRPAMPLARSRWLVLEPWTLLGGLVGAQILVVAITASYGFGPSSGGGVDRSDDASPASVVANATALTAANSSTGSNDWSTTVWNFGTPSQNPALRWVTASNFTCDANLIPPGRTCGGIIPGQGR